MYLILVLGQPAGTVPAGFSKAVIVVNEVDCWVKKRNLIVPIENTELLVDVNLLKNSYIDLKRNAPVE